YVTTERFEAETLIEDTEINQKPTYTYHDLGFKESQNLVKRIGFNPMCSVEMDGNISARGLDVIATKLVKEGLYVATELNGNLQKYIPHDAEAREEMVKLALQLNRRRRLFFDPAGYLMVYSNRPNKIVDFI
ncbi:MAG: hypothetical protein WCK29_04465, partial [archaeon]